MTAPLESLNAAAARLVHEGNTLGGQTGNRLKAIAATIRCSVASIRTALEPTTTRGRHPKFNLIVGDEA